MKGEIKKIVKILNDIRNEECLSDLDDNVILEQAVDIFISDRIQEGKQANIQSINKDKKVAVNGSNKATDSSKEPLTEKQRNFLIKNDYRGDLNISKLEARKLIEEYIKSQKGEEY